MSIITAPSSQVQQSARFATVDELYIPSSLTFDRYGIPSEQGCIEFNTIYQDVNNLFQDPIALGDGSHLAFLHIPKNAGTSIAGWYERGSKKLPRIIKRTVYNGDLQQYELLYNCSKHKAENPFGSTCACTHIHIQPRYMRPNAYDKKYVFCVVRDPLDRALSKFKMGLRVGDKEHMINFLTRLPKDIYHLRGDPYCHEMAQYEYLWNENGERMCQHVLRYENGISEGVNAIMKAYNVTDAPIMEDALVSDTYQMHHPDTALSVLDVPLEVAAEVRKFFWRDYCLLGYYKNNPWIPDTDGIVSGNLAKSKLKIIDSENRELSEALHSVTGHDVNIENSESLLLNYPNMLLIVTIAAATVAVLFQLLHKTTLQ